MNYLDIEPECDTFNKLFHKIKNEDVVEENSKRSVECSSIPGFCVKTKNVKTNEKFFVNICHSIQMKRPLLELSEDELRSILASDLANTFTIPLLIRPIHETEDKDGIKARVCDVIINTDFYINKVAKSLLYKTFLITVTLETIEKDKYDAELDKNNWIVLKNKKYQQKLTIDNTINCSESDKSIENGLSAILNINDGNNDGLYIKDNISGPKTNLISGVDNNRSRIQLLSDDDISTKQDVISTQLINAEQLKTRPKTETPKYKLTLDVFNNCLQAVIKLPKVKHSDQLELKVGDNRIVLHCLHYSLDIFVPLIIRNTQIEASFNSLSKVMNIKMALK